MTSESLDELKTAASAAYRRFQAQPADVAALEAAIRSVRQALDLSGTAAAERGALLTSLGVMLTDRYQVGHAIADLEDGVAAYRQAVEITLEDSPSLARRLSNLGTGLWERYSATGGYNVLAEALEFLARAVRLTPGDSADLPRRVLNLSAAAYEVAVADPDSGLVTMTVDLVESSLDGAAGVVAGQLRGNLASLLMVRYGRAGERADLERAIAHNRRALELGVPPLYEPRVHSNLGNCLWRVYGADGDPGALEEAVECHQAAVERAPPEWPARIDYLWNLGTSLAELGRVQQRPELVEEATRTWESAWTWIDRFVGRAPVAHRLGWQDDLEGLSGRIVTALVAAGDSASRCRALELVENSKSRLLAAMLQWPAVPVPGGVDPAAAARERELTQELAQLDRVELLDQERWPPPAAAWGQAAARAHERERALGELEAAWAEIAGTGSDGSAFVALRRGSQASIRDLVAVSRSRGDGTALLSVLIAPETTFLLILRPDREVPDVVWAPLGDKAWATLARRLNREVRTGRGASRGEGWLEPLLEPLARAGALLHGVRRVVIAPHRRGHLVPWSVVTRRAGWSLADGAPLPVSTVPSLALLQRLVLRPPSARSGAVVVGDPRGDLVHAAAEARAVARELGVDDPLIGPSATVADVRTALGGARLAHIAAHARFGTGSPLDASIALADGELTARDILELGLDVDLMVLSACETGVAAPLAGDELMGVAHAFLAAGARSMVVTLWPVNDMVTSGLMSRFYNAVGQGSDRAAALSSAANAVSREPAWSHPFFWGAFMQVGAW